MSAPEGIKKQDLRDLKTQEELMAEYLNEFETTEEVLERVYELNKKYNKQIEENEEVHRNVNWSLQNLEWDNLFNYGESNSIDFTKLEGIVGIFGKNYSGKSSIVDTLLYSMYNSTSKSIRKNLNIINQNRDSCTARATIKINDEQYVVERSSKKYVKRLKGVETQEASTDLEFYKKDMLDNETSLNGTSRQDTDSNVRKHFGTVQDFLMTSMASQLDSLSFINEGSTKRKEYLAKFLDLQIFDKKFKLAKEESALTKAALRKLEGVDFDQQIKSIQKDITKSELGIESHKAECRSMREDLQNLNIGLSDLKNKVESVPAEIIGPVLTQQRIDKKERLILKTTADKTKATKELEQSEQKFHKISDFLETFNVETYKEKKALIEQKKQRLADLIKEMGLLSDEKLRGVRKQDLLLEVPCGSQYPSCKFIKDAHEATTLVQVTESKMSTNAVETNMLGQQISEMNPRKVEEYLNNYNQLLDKKTSLATIIATSKLTIERCDALLFREQVELESLKNKSLEYVQNREAIENLKELLTNKKELQTLITEKEKQIDTCEQKVMKLHQKHGSLQEKLKFTKRQRKEKRTRTKFCCLPSLDDMLSSKRCVI